MREHKEHKESKERRANEAYKADVGKGKNRKTIGAAVLSLALFGWYFSPGMVRLRSMPQIVETPTTGGAFLCSLQGEGGTAWVRESGDETIDRVQKNQGEAYTVSLLGILPLRTVEKAVPGAQVTLGGEVAGIVLHTKGVQVVGLGGVETAEGSLTPAAAAGLKEGDTILAVNGVQIQGAAELAAMMETLEGEGCLLTCLREGEAFQVTLWPALEAASGVYRLGAYVRDSTSGIGTVSFIKDGQFCALGHPIADIDTGRILERGSGYITPASVVGTVKGAPGQVGELVGAFSLSEQDAIGTIEKNTDFGIAGELLHGASLEYLGARETLSIAQPGEVHTGAATLYTTLEGDKPQGYACRILRADVQSAPQVQGVIVEITDEALLKKTGGIVPGMSGSPLVQDGKLIGVITHVFVNDPSRGYCIYAQWMVQELLGAE